MRKSAALLVLLVLVPALPSTLAMEEQSWRYVAATETTPRHRSGCSTYENLDVRVAVGGACLVPVTPGESVRIRVVDDLRGADVGFDAAFATIVETPLVIVMLQSVTDCGSIVTATGAVDLVVPDGCTHLDVRLLAGATTGTLSIGNAPP